MAAGIFAEPTLCRISDENAWRQGNRLVARRVRRRFGYRCGPGQGGRREEGRFRERLSQVSGGARRENWAEDGQEASSFQGIEGGPGEEPGRRRSRRPACGSISGEGQQQGSPATGRPRPEAEAQPAA